MSASDKTGIKSRTSGPSSASGSQPKGATASRQARPSDKLNPKTIDPIPVPRAPLPPFTALVRSLAGNRQFNCLVHGSVKHKLSWSQSPETVMFDPLLVLLAEGIRETIHPYSFVARIGFKELLETSDANEKAVPLLPKLIPPLRAALNHTDESVFMAGLESLLILSDAVGPALNPHLKILLPSVGKQMMRKKDKEQIFEALQHLEQNGGRECLAIIKSKVPTYSSPFC